MFGPLPQFPAQEPSETTLKALPCSKSRSVLKVFAAPCLLQLFDVHTLTSNAAVAPSSSSSSKAGRDSGASSAEKRPTIVVDPLKNVNLAQRD